MGSRSLRLGLRGQALRRIGRSEEAVSVLREAVALRESVWVRTPRDAGSSVIAGLALYRDLAMALASVGRGDEAFEQLEHGVARVGLDLADRDDPDPWRGLIPRVQRALRPDEAIVLWPRSSTTMFVPDRPLYACIVRTQGAVQWIRIESRARYPRLGTVREALWVEMRAASAWPRRTVDTTTVAELAHVMWKERFAPLEASLAGVRHLIVCSPDYLAGGPLGVLRDANGRYLTERFAISYVPSALRFARARERARPPGGAPRPALLVGDPAYSAADPGHFSRLTGAAEEIRALAARLPSATVLTGADACAARLRQLASSGAIGRFGVVHIAAHTDVSSSRAFESSLVLAPDSPGGAASSRLVAREIADHWKLDADLVCLAGCRSMQGLPSATEGYLGLQQAFLAAGARSLLITIWPVDDQATARLMTSFYAHLADRTHPVDRAEALREAQNELRTWRAPDGRHPYAHPAYWAGFALVGDPR
jgi:CHAT domain-containing protein